MNKQITTYDTVKQQLMSPKMAKGLKGTASGGIDVHRFQRIAVAAVAQNPALLECDRQSLYTACAQAATAGLYTDGFLGEAYLVPFKGKVQFQPGYKGLMKLIRQSSGVAKFHAEDVREHDVFEVVGGYDPNIVHKHAKGDRGKLIAAYAIVKFDNGEVSHKVVYPEDIARARSASQSAKSEFSPWNKHEPEMWIKTAVKKLSKLLPLSPVVQQVIEADNNLEAGRELTEVNGITIAHDPAPDYEDQSQDEQDHVPQRTKQAVKKAAGKAAVEADVPPPQEEELF